jgi:hypothetical protein
VYCLFICLELLVSGLWESSRTWLPRLLAAASRRARQVTLDHLVPICFLSLVYKLACMHYYCTLASYFRNWVHTWLAILSHAVMSVVQVFPSLWCWVWVVLIVESVGLPSVMMWGDRGDIRCYGLSKVWNGGDSWNPSGDVVCHAQIC